MIKASKSFTIIGMENKLLISNSIKMERRDTLFHVHEVLRDVRNSELLRKLLLKDVIEIEHPDISNNEYDIFMLKYNKRNDNSKY